MARHSITETMEDHALERVPDAEREGWLQITWNTAGLITTLVILFFGAVVCFVAGVKIALAAGMVSFAIGSSIGWAIARIAYQTGCSNTLITRKYGLGTRGSALASLIFGCLIVGFLAVENGLLYRGFLFFFEAGAADDLWWHDGRMDIVDGIWIQTGDTIFFHHADRIYCRARLDDSGCMATVRWNCRGSVVV